MDNPLATYTEEQLQAEINRRAWEHKKESHAKAVYRDIVEVLDSSKASMLIKGYAMSQSSTLEDIEITLTL